MSATVCRDCSLPWIGGPCSNCGSAEPAAEPTPPAPEVEQPAPVPEPVATPTEAPVAGHDPAPGAARRQRPRTRRAGN